MSVKRLKKNNQSRRKISNKKAPKHSRKSIRWDHNWVKLKVQLSKLIRTPFFQDHRASTGKQANHGATNYIIMFRWKRDFCILLSLVTFTFIRHGQYNLKGATDAEQTLTEKGRMQAKLAGQRLRRLQVSVTQFIISTMARAQQTASIMLSQLPKGRSFQIRNDPMLEEGAPIPPIPEHNNWQPSSSVRLRHS